MIQISVLAVPALTPQVALLTTLPQTVGRPAAITMAKKRINFLIPTFSLAAGALAAYWLTQNGKRSPSFSAFLMYFSTLL